MPGPVTPEDLDTAVTRFEVVFAALQAQIRIAGDTQAEIAKADQNRDEVMMMAVARMRRLHARRHGSL